MTVSNNNSEFSANAVADYLRDHPDFFEQHPDLLAEISLPHASGEAISLIERQVGVLRERNTDLQDRLSGLMETARDNDRLFDKTKRLVLSLLDVKTLPEIIEALYESLSSDFQVSHYNLLLLGDEQALPPSQAKVVGIDEANDRIGTLLRTNRTICGVLRTEELQVLFGERAGEVGSAAVIPLSHGQTFGVLALGHTDSQYYRSSMGTLYLSYIADILNRLIPLALNR